jgi:hypothetical protein
VLTYYIFFKEYRVSIEDELSKKLKGNNLIFLNSLITNPRNDGKTIKMRSVNSDLMEIFKDDIFNEVLQLIENTPVTYKFSKIFINYFNFI